MDVWQRGVESAVSPTTLTGLSCRLGCSDLIQGLALAVMNRNEVPQKLMAKPNRSEISARTCE